MKINRSGGARRSSGRPAGEPKKAIGHRVLVRFHAQLVQYLKEKEEELLNNVRSEMESSKKQDLAIDKELQIMESDVEKKLKENKS